MESIVTAELFGILKAMQFSITNFSSSNIAIFTDSKTSLLLLQDYHWSYRVLVDQILSCFKICLSTKTNIYLQWVPSHSGIPGNELVDSVAKDEHNLRYLTNHPKPVMENVSSCKRAIFTRWQRDREQELRVSRLGLIRPLNLLEP